MILKLQEARENTITMGWFIKERICPMVLEEPSEKMEPDLLMDSFWTEKDMAFQDGQAKKVILKKKSGMQVNLKEILEID